MTCLCHYASMLVCWRSNFQANEISTHCLVQLDHCAPVSVLQFLLNNSQGEVDGMDVTSEK